MKPGYAITHATPLRPATPPDPYICSYSTPPTTTDHSTRNSWQPLSIHTSASWTWTRLSDLGHPRHIDDVACRFPELTILMSHGGYPRGAEACLIAWKHPRTCTSNWPRIAPNTSPRPAGWDALMRFGQTTIRDKIIYGTGAFPDRTGPQRATVRRDARAAGATRSPCRIGCGATQLDYCGSD